MATRKAKAKRRSSSGRELIDTGTSKRYVRRGPGGRFSSDQVSVGKSLSADRRKSAKTTVKKGQGDKGDQRPSR